MYLGRFPNHENSSWWFITVQTQKLTHDWLPAVVKAFTHVSSLHLPMDSASMLCPLELKSLLHRAVVIVW